MAENKLNHLAVIMDGNGRWAEQHGLDRAHGHRKGAEKVAELIQNLEEFDIKYLTLYAFSTENWKRSEEEVSTLMNLLCEFIDANIEELAENKIRVMALGQIDGLPVKCIEKLKKLTEETSKDFNRTVILALNYGGRAEIVNAVHKICSEVIDGKMTIDQIDEKTISSNLYIPDIPDPDLMIRTSGELRISNFLLWQLSYSELYFTDVLWPDFDKTELEKAVETYNKRKRRFGGRK